MEERFVCCVFSVERREPLKPIHVERGAYFRLQNYQFSENKHTNPTPDREWQREAITAGPGDSIHCGTIRLLLLVQFMLIFISVFGRISSPPSVFQHRWISAAEQRLNYRTKEKILFVSTHTHSRCRMFLIRKLNSTCISTLHSNL